MAYGKFVSYLRVSTTRQGKSGLGLEAQRETVTQYLNGGSWSLLAEFVEIESGRRPDRPELERALAACRLHRAALVVSKVDRLTRSVAFLSKLLAAGVDVRFADMPKIEGPTGRFMIQQMVAVAELEAGLIGLRTKAALKAAKARGVTLGGFRGGSVSPDAREKGRAVRQANAARRTGDVLPVIREIMGNRPDVSLGAVARELTARQIPTASGSTRWQAVQVQRVLARAGQ